MQTGAAAENAVLVLGGANSGKSMYAQKLARTLARGGPLFYLATMEPYDGEDQARIGKHRRDREGWGFETLEIPIHLRKAVGRVRGGVVLLDSLTSLLTNSMFLPGGPGNCAEEPVMSGIAALADAARMVVFVSDDLFSDGLVYEEATEDFRRQLGHIHRRTAASCRSVVRLAYGSPTVWKGADLLLTGEGELR